MSKEEACHVCYCSAACELILQRLWATFLQAVHRRLRQRLHHPVRVPAVRVGQLRAGAGTAAFVAAAGRQQLDVGHGDARAGDGVAAREAHRRAAAAARVVRAADPPVRDAVDAHGGGLVGAAGAGAAVRIAVVLVDDDAAPDVHHLDGVEHHPRHRPGAALPRLDPHAVVGVDDARAAHGHVRHARPRAARAQAADADAVAVHARDVLDAHPRAAAADADAVVAVADPGVEDPDGARVFDVDAVGVRARRRRADDEAVDQHPAAPVELEVELRAVLHPQALHAHVAARHELDQLHSTTYLTLSRINTRLINLNN